MEPQNRRAARRCATGTPSCNQAASQHRWICLGAHSGPQQDHTATVSRTRTHSTRSQASPTELDKSANPKLPWQPALRQSPAAGCSQLTAVVDEQTRGPSANT
ncbi:hypothetical protein NDU88_005993 [Pleurodeles waltl]|uniref:Uncharacterized protein n=1 Tax=Pleurodeles waltl TaxID=8319 RepID=A0AAV7NSY3_PLEWA|nr:hypothetical protein NDU88_005993 [Pleurodeles waltl]